MKHYLLIYSIISNNSKKILIKTENSRKGINEYIASDD